METTEVHGLRIAYERAGDGPPLVPLHGYVGDGPTTRRPQLEGLGDEFTVIAWDAPGRRSVLRPARVVRHDRLRRLPGRLVERLGLERPHVAGLSFGGALALALFRRHAALPATLTLASASPSPPCWSTATRTCAPP
ncbi:MAG: alpha/beta fold hydrolase [Actinomycetota bacterium]